jgi:colanic acid/amylovoran biosynthesis protein
MGASEPGHRDTTGSHGVEEIRIVVTTIVSLNPGDAAILEGTVEILRRTFQDRVVVTVVDPNGDVAGKYYPWADFRLSLFRRRRRNVFFEWGKRLGYLHRIRQVDSFRYRWSGKFLKGRLHWLAAALLSREEQKSLREYVAADLVIASGGTYLVDHYNLLPSLLDYELTLSLGKPLVIFPQSLGPFRAERYRARLRRMFDSAAAILLRDERSAGHLMDLGVQNNQVRVTGDAAFALADPVRFRARATVATGPLRLAISLREWQHFRGEAANSGQARYEQSVERAVSSLVRERAAQVSFVSTCQGIPEYWVDDSEVAERVLARLPSDVQSACTLDSQFRQPTELMEEFARFDAVIATRMHAAILAMSAGVPALGIAYEFKTLELYASMGLERWAVDINTIDPDEFASLALRFVDDLEALRPEVAAAVRVKRDAVFGISDLLEPLLLGTAPNSNRSVRHHHDVP